ncbi:MAG TPA: permease prefix domain 1-containing protein [Terracidiphilus sp.]|nr:permease prefix domain 1-containing protein [Terracidiphilus sp.]
MAKPLSALRERLLEAGVAPRHVSRYVKELQDHLTDLRAEEERAGRSRTEAEAIALSRLGAVNELAQAMIGKRQLLSLSSRAPWAMFGVAPVVLLAAAWFAALLILWTGWQMFLPGTQTPFVAQPGSIFRLENVYFQFGRMIYFGAPFLIGWGIVWLAARQRLSSYWPALSFVLVAGLAATAQVHALRPSGEGTTGHVMLGFGVDDVAAVMVHFSVIFMATLLPYAVVRWRRRSATI